MAKQLTANQQTLLKAYFQTMLDKSDLSSGSVGIAADATSMSAQTLYGVIDRKAGAYKDPRAKTFIEKLQAKWFKKPTINRLYNRHRESKGYPPLPHDVPDVIAAMADAMPAVKKAERATKKRKGARIEDVEGRDVKADSINVLHAMMLDPTTPSSTRAKAANDLLKHSIASPDDALDELGALKLMRKLLKMKGDPDPKT